MKIAIIIGTRPEIIKMSPLMRECDKRNLDYYLLHTGQHYSFEMDKVFFDELNLPIPKYNLDVGSGNHGAQTAKMLDGIEKILLEDAPDIILVQGDTNTVLSGALVASKLKIKIGHVEAGLRSFDRNMPEEINRIIADHISDYLFAPTEKSKQHLLMEGINDEKIFVTGNTIVDAVFQNLKISNMKKNFIDELNLKKKEYFLTTVHRAENTDNENKLYNILKGFEQLYNEYKLPIVFPAHPRTVKMIKKYGFEIPNGTKIIEPVGYLNFLQLENGAKLILTDSGGLQEEACILGVPCITLRDNTERPETVDVGANFILGSKTIVEIVKKMINIDNKWKNPYGNGMSSSEIIKIISTFI